MVDRMKLLIGYDGSICADEAIDDLRRAGLPREAEVLVVTVGEEPIVPPFASHGEKTVVGEKIISIVNHANTHVSGALDDARALACVARQQLESYFPLWDVHVHAVGGRPATELVKAVREWKPDLIVVGSQGRSAIGRLILGSVSLEVATHSPCNVRIGRLSTGNDTMREPRVLVGVDRFPDSEQVLKEVLEREWPVETKLRIIAVDDEQSPILDGPISAAGKSAITLPEASRLKVVAEIRKGDPASILKAEVIEWRADCIFLGAAGFANTIHNSRESVATRLAKNAFCSIEIVR
jgi:nucleotide-binding universal stress UspA family protein